MAYAYNPNRASNVSSIAYGYGGLGYSPEVKSLPPPDPKWTDPVKNNKAYIKKIQKVYIQKGFQGLKTEMLFLMEVLIESIELKEEIAQTIDSSIKEEGLFKASVKFFNFPFWEIDDMLIQEGTTTNSCGPSYSALFQEIFSMKEQHNASVTSEDYLEKNDDGEKKQDNIREEEKVTILQEKEKKEEEQEKSGLVTDAKKSERKEPRKSKATRKSRDSKRSKDVEANLDLKESRGEGKRKGSAKFSINKGKSALVVMNGLKIISSFQEYTVDTKMTRCDVMDGENRVERILGKSTLRLPETFRQFVLSTVTSNKELPCREKYTSSQNLVDMQNKEVGTILITVSLACFGNAVENCIRETDVDVYEHTYGRRTFISKVKDTEREKRVPAVDPKLALHLLKTNAIIKQKRFDSTELIRYCVNWSMIDGDKAENRRALKGNECDWIKTAKTVLATTSLSSVSSNISKEDELEALLRTQKRICRDFTEKENDRFKSKKSLFDRLEDVKIQTGVAELETNNPFLELAQISPSNSKTPTGESKSVVQPRRKSSLKQTPKND